MRKYIDTVSELCEARMMWESYHEAYVFVEGTSDRRFFSTILGHVPHISFRALDGWERVVSVIDLAKKAGFSYTFGIIDKDYHAVINDGCGENEQLAFTDNNDIEMMLVLSSAYDKFLQVCGNEEKISMHQDARTPVLTAAFPVGILRAISLSQRYCLDFDGIECKDFVSRDNLYMNTDMLIQKIFHRTQSKGTRIDVSVEDLKSQLEHLQTSAVPIDYCNGHDVLDILCLAMTKLFSSASANQYTPRNVFDYLLMSYSFDEFKGSKLYAKLNVWLQRFICT